MPYHHGQEPKFLSTYATSSSFQLPILAAWGPAELNNGSLAYGSQFFHPCGQDIDSDTRTYLHQMAPVPLPDGPEGDWIKGRFLLGQNPTQSSIRAHAAYEFSHSEQLCKGAAELGNAIATTFGIDRAFSVAEIMDAGHWALKIEQPSDPSKYFHLRKLDPEIVGTIQGLPQLIEDSSQTATYNSSMDPVLNQLAGARQLGWLFSDGQVQRTHDKYRGLDRVQSVPSTFNLGHLFRSLSRQILEP